jgi:hypothetical protein
MNEKDKVMLNMWERKFLRKVYRQFTDQEVWKMWEWYKTTGLVVGIKRRTLQWFRRGSNRGG